ncbi:hypothetical protein [Pseudodesulfovibrio methanolicus]|uniref:YkuD domain-containing protein n=1 Tax=Pseudodesulfovibrio methanolicus TaxID=3126690 RepID=A0ABZ2IXS7_9BACT
MAQHGTGRIGENQLVYGMPKHMSARATGEGLDRYMMDQKAQGNVEGDSYWTVHPAPGACEKCRAMALEIYLEEPERPHPHCGCEYKRHDIRDPKTEWVFDGKSLCVKGGPCFACVSGPHGKGALPKGIYTVVGDLVSLERCEENAGFCDKAGNCWWVPIAPDFDAKGRGHFGIHPDGNIPGTKGCIGLTAPDTGEAKEFFENVKGQKVLVK